MTGMIDDRDIMKNALSLLELFQNQTDEVDNSDYHFEGARLQSFKTWPLIYIDPANLAADGFYYTGVTDTVRCFECQVEISKWQEGDDPMTNHQRLSGRCRFIRKIPCGNVPIGVDPDTVPAQRPQTPGLCGPYEVDCRAFSGLVPSPPPPGVDICGSSGVEYRPFSGPDCFSTTSPNFQFPSSAQLGCFDISRFSEPVHPEYGSYDARIVTYRHWPKAMPQTKEQLADAGLYYTTKGDVTVCHHCGGALKDWEPEDVPWEQHAKLFPECFYLFLIKGQKYIDNVKGQHNSKN